MAVENVTTGNDDGTNFGRSADKIGFYGLATPIVKATLTTTVVAGDVITLVATALIEIQAALKNLGLITTV